MDADTQTAPAPLTPAQRERLERLAAELGNGPSLAHAVYLATPDKQSASERDLEFGRLLRALLAEGDALRERAEAAERQAESWRANYCTAWPNTQSTLLLKLERAEDRIRELAVLFGVPDGGRYLNDWKARAEKHAGAETALSALRAELATEKADAEHCWDKFQRDLSALRAERDEAKAERDAITEAAKASVAFDVRRASAAEARAKGMEEALTPFAALADVEVMSGGVRVVPLDDAIYPAGRITWGMVRGAARASALAQMQEEKG